MADPILVTDQQGTTNAKPILVTGIGGGGSGGTTNYNQLSNKPRINNVELSGNKTLAQLGFNVDTEISATSTNPVENKAVYEGLDEKLEKVQLAGTDLTISNHTVNIPVDNALSSTSTNPVQNKMVLDTTGNKSNLTTTNKTNLVGAINEHDTEIGNLTNLTTTQKSNLVGAINEHDTEIGTLSSLTTTAKSNLVGAVNELDGEVGNLASLTTTAKNTIVASINELDSDVGDKTTLKTTAKNNVVSAINENYDTNTSQQNEINVIGNSGAKNISGRQGGVSLVTGGITYTLNEDMTITANGTATSHAYYNLNASYKFKAGKTYRISSGLNPNTNGTSVQIIVNNAAVADTITTGEATYTPTADTTGNLLLVVRNGNTVSNLKISPMMVDDRIKDRSYTPPYDTGWMNLELDTTKVTAGGILVRKVGNVVDMVVNNITLNTVANGYVVVSSKNMLNPTGQFYIGCMYVTVSGPNDYKLGSISLATNGTISVGGGPTAVSGARFYGRLTYTV